MRIRDLQGLGPKSEEWLNAVGIQSADELKEIGAIAAYLKLKSRADINPGLNMLYALVGALEDEHWLKIAKREKANLIRQLDDYEQLENILRSEGLEL